MPGEVLMDTRSDIAIKDALKAIDKACKANQAAAAAYAAAEYHVFDGSIPRERLAGLDAVYRELARFFGGN
jgi:hypothetical protein